MAEVSVHAETKRFVPKKSWTTEDTGELYNLYGWGAPYYSINKKGHLSVLPQGAQILDPIREADRTLP